MMDGNEIFFFIFSEGANCDVLVSAPCCEISMQHISSRRLSIEVDVVQRTWAGS